MESLLETHNETFDSKVKLPLRASQVKRSGLLVQRVTEEEIELISNNPTRHSEPHTIDLWRKYISQRASAEGALG